MKAKFDLRAEGLGPLLQYLEQTSEDLILVDGHSGMGKTFLARRCSVHLRFQHVDTDDFLGGHKGQTYFERLDLERLGAKLVHGPAIVSGILALNWAEKLTIKRRFVHIVVEKTVPAGLENDERRRRKRFGTDAYFEERKLPDAADIIVSGHLDPDCRD